MSDLIESFEVFDKSLVKQIDTRIEPILTLEDIEKGSLKTILATVLKKVPDNAINDLDYKKIIGHYLVKAKYIILNHLEGKVEITDAKEIETIELELQKTAKETGVESIPTYAPVGRRSLIRHIERFNSSLEHLSSQDKVYYESEYGKASFNMELSFDADAIEDLITNETIESNSKMILKVKKPDYLGDSKWEFKHGNRTVSAKITDSEWLRSFQNRGVDVRPQDSLVCEVKTTAKYDHDYELITNNYEITKVIKINPRPNSPQTSLIE